MTGKETIMQSIIKLAPCVAILALGCAATKRDRTSYRRDTLQVLETRNPAVKTCYDEALKVDPTVKGTITVQFVVEKKSGAFTKVTIDPTKSNAPESAVSCVLGAVNGLKLEPPDASEGRATFVYELVPAS
jgi:hypothetical protein